MLPGKKTKRVVVFGLPLLIVLMFAAKNYKYLDTSATQLGYNFWEKLLIVHADDLGLTESTNQAFIEAQQQGVINSASIMVPGRAYDEIVDYAIQYPEFDWGIHLTLTSSRNDYRMEGSAPKTEIKSLLDENGFFYKTRDDIYEYADLDEVYTEIKAQLEKVLEDGVKISHIDSHMGVLYHSSEYLRLYLKLGEEFDIPVFIPKWNIEGEEFRKVLAEFDSPVLFVDYTFIRGEEKKDKSLEDIYNKFFSSLDPGVSQILIHPAKDVSELKAFMGNKVGYGAEWRYKEFQYFNNPNLKNNLFSDVKFTTWSELYQKSKETAAK